MEKRIEREKKLKKDRQKKKGQKGIRFNSRNAYFVFSTSVIFTEYVEGKANQNAVTGDADQNYRKKEKNKMTEKDNTALLTGQVSVQRILQGN